MNHSPLNYKALVNLYDLSICSRFLLHTYSIYHNTAIRSTEGLVKYVDSLKKAKSFDLTPLHCFSVSKVR